MRCSNYVSELTICHEKKLFLQSPVERWIGAYCLILLLIPLKRSDFANAPIARRWGPTRENIPRLMANRRSLTSSYTLLSPGIFPTGPPYGNLTEINRKLSWILRSCSRGRVRTRTREHGLHPRSTPYSVGKQSLSAKQEFCTFLPLILS
jgi:hypothetical protein